MWSCSSKWGHQFRTGQSHLLHPQVGSTFLFASKVSEVHVCHSFLGNNEIVQVLIDNGADINAINARNSNGNTALISAIANFNVTENVGTMTLLTDFGADVNAVNRQNESGRFVL